MWCTRRGAYSLVEACYSFSFSCLDNAMKCVVDGSDGLNKRVDVFMLGIIHFKIFGNWLYAIVY